jgi:superfamily II DNA helicase RecQ
MLKVFTLKFENKIESFDDSALSNFLTDKKVIKWKSHFFADKDGYYWTVMVEYISLSTSSTSIPLKKEKKGNDEYKKILTENDWPIFKRLREWRNEKGKSQGIPPYIIFTNVQLAQISVTRPQSLNAFQEIQGIGNAKKEKYGNEVIHIIKSVGLSLKTGRFEGKNG